jgi:twitching motility protein PilU
MDIYSLLEKMEKYNASDLYLTVGLPPSWRGNNIVQEEKPQALDNDDIIAMLEQITTESERDRFHRIKELNAAVIDKNNNRYRVNCFFQQQKIGMVIRRMHGSIPTTEELNLDGAYREAIMLNRGLVLVVGPSGSGKSTAIASMLDYRNKNGSGHVVTVEDPIEYVHEHNKCIFTQREIGIDTLSWTEALKNALRQRPDVIYIGEIRDKDAMENAINFAETGHLCIATLHATSASQAIERVANFFPTGAKMQSLYSLAQVLKYIFAQRLITAKSGEKRPIIEILKNVGFVKPLIVDGKIPELKDLMQKNSDYGMMTFEQSLMNMLDKDIISEETAIQESDNPDNMSLQLLQSRTNNARTAYRAISDQNSIF